MKEANICKDILFGTAVGDALGVPVEFLDRKSIAENPVKEMIGYGTHNLPAGTFSDDSSLTFCLAEALTHEYDLQRIADNFIQWLENSFWTPYGVVFDVGIATSQAIRRLQKGCQPDLAGGSDVSDNGNGSLMRILPVLAYSHSKSISDRYRIAKQVSSLTHAHVRSIIACFYYLEFARGIINGLDKFAIYQELQSVVTDHLNSLQINGTEIRIYERLLVNNIQDLQEDQIHSTGYVVHTLEASIWCLLTTDNYEQATLKAVNLGFDSDTTGAVTGGLAGLLYGWESIPPDWLNCLARRNDIEDLANRFEACVTR